MSARRFFWGCVVLFLPLAGAIAAVLIGALLGVHL